MVDIQTEKVGSVVVVSLVGSALDAGNAARFRAQTADLFEADQHFVFSLKELKFVDSSGIGALLSCLRKVHQAGGEIKLCELQPNVQALFELVRMNRLFEVFETREDAIASFKH